MNPEFSESADFYKRHLRPFPVRPTTAEPAALPFGAFLPDLFETFQKTTGFHLTFVRNRNQAPPNSIAVTSVSAGGRAPIGYLILTRQRENLPMLETASAVRLAESIAQILGETSRWGQALRQREAELAVLESSCAFDLPSLIGLADRLPQTLKHGAKAIGCEAAALFLLNQETTSLKLRAVWGLPLERLTDPPRFLGRAMADLEALLGNAVVLNEPYLMEEWNAPETFATSVCVPVASESAILGTVWFFSDKKRDFRRRDLLFLEMTAGRLATELEFHFLSERLSLSTVSPETAPVPATPPGIPAAGIKPYRETDALEKGGSPDRAPENVDLPVGDIPVPSAKKEETSSDVSIPSPRTDDSSPIGGNGSPDADNSSAKNGSSRDVPSDDLSETVPHVSVSGKPVPINSIPEKETRDFLNLLEKHLEDKGTCKNLTLFVVKNSPADPKS